MRRRSDEGVDHGRIRWGVRLVVAALTATVLAVPTVLAVLAVPVGATAPPSSVPGTVWLCRPGAPGDPCTAPLTTTVVTANGTTVVRHAEPAAHPPIDCFYVYPTVSAQPTVNADLTVDPEERAIAVAQASRFSTVCRVWAPMYRQLTIAAITGSGHVTDASVDEAYDGVLAAWRDYLVHDNHGRGVVFIGHSQGAAMLIRLLQTQVDPDPAVRRLLVSAIILGGNVTVPVGGDVGGSFRHIPACRRPAQTGCVIAYSSFDHPPPSDSLFGRVGQGVSSLSGASPAAHLQVLCVNPAAITGGSGSLLAYFPTSPFPGPLGAVDRPVPQAATPWVEYPDLYTARCESVGGATWLQIDDIGTAGDPRPRVSDTLGPTWGLHLNDVNLALGNLVALVGHQAAAYRR